MGQVAEICAGERWILDTAYGMRLDVPLRLLSRTAARVIDGRPVCNGNRQTLRTAVDRDSIVRWHFRSFARKRARIRAREADLAAPKVVRLTSQRETRRRLATLSEPATSPDQVR